MVVKTQLVALFLISHQQNQRRQLYKWFAKFIKPNWTHHKRLQIEETINQQTISSHRCMVSCAAAVDTEIKEENKSWADISTRSQNCNRMKNWKRATNRNVETRKIIRKIKRDQCMMTRAKERARVPHIIFSIDNSKNYLKNWIMVIVVSYVHSTHILCVLHTNFSLAMMHTILIAYKDAIVMLL